MRKRRIIEKESDSDNLEKCAAVPEGVSKADEWFYKMTPERQREYLKEHPHSKFSPNEFLRDTALKQQKSAGSSFTNSVLDEMKKSYKTFSHEQKSFFKNGQHKSDSDDRRNAGEAIADKAKGFAKTLKHETKEWKTAASAIRKLASGNKINHHEKGALKSVGTHLGIVAGEMLLTGGFSHSIAVAIPHLVGGLLQHSAIIGGTKSAVFSSEKPDTQSMSDSEILELLVKEFAKSVKSAPIKKSSWIKAVAKHNETKKRK